MTTEQIIIFAVLGIALVLFVWGRFRYDIVACGALLTATLAGVVPAGDAFSGFGHPAVITVAAVLVISQALQNSGLLDIVAARLAGLTGNTMVHIALMTGVGALISGFMNNVGALALLMPLALRNARANGQSPSHILMPLSFGTILGGLTTQIGTPPNIIVANYRAGAAGEPFSMFDYSPVGALVAIAGVIFVVLIGWRLVPTDRRGRQSAEEAFEIRDYMTELKIGEGAKLIGTTVRDLEKDHGDTVAVVGIIRGHARFYSSLRMMEIAQGDIVIVRGDPADLKNLVGKTGIDFVGRADFDTQDLRSEDVGLMEMVVQPGAAVENRSAARLHFRRRYGANLLAIAREGRPIKRRLGEVPFVAGDVLLVQGELDALPDVAREMGCLPLATRALSLTANRNIWLPLAIFIGAIALTAAGVTTAAVAFALAVGVMVVSGTITPRAMYQSIDWPVIALLATMIPLGGALEATGGTALIAGLVLDVGAALDPVIILAIVLVVTMTLSDIMNNAATAVVMAPISAQIAIALGVSPDPFLMAVAIGASCAFLTPIGHQNNVLVMGPGGYRFGDYWRMGLPLEILIVAVAVPLIVIVWPLGG